MCSGELGGVCMKSGDLGKLLPHGHLSLGHFAIAPAEGTQRGRAPARSSIRGALLFML